MNLFRNDNSPSRFAAQRERSAQLDEIRLQRRLTGPEQAEADRLAHCLYMREWRAAQAKVEARLR